MLRSNKGAIALLLIVSAGFLYGLWRLYDLRFSTGNIYPAYSSLRADPFGALAFYESIGQLPELHSTRNFLAVPEIPKEKATVLFLGLDPFTFHVISADRLKEYEALAATGARVVIAMEPVRRPDKPTEPAKEVPHKDDSKKDEPAPIELRWGVTFDYIIRSTSEPVENPFARPKLTSLYFRYKDQRLSKVELPFGKGAVVLLANSYPMSNEALSNDRDPKLLADALGDNGKIIFDEHHLGLSEEGGVATLARKFHLEGLAIALLTVLALFIWKNSSSFLPPRAAPTGEDSVAAKDVNSGLANLLRRNISKQALLQTILEQWEKSQHGGRYHSPSRIARVRNSLEHGGDPAETYRQAAHILSERNNP